MSDSLFSQTYCLDYQVPDSACTATAYLCGVKNNYGTIGVTAQVPLRDCAASTDNSTHLSSIAEWALNAGKDAGIVTTTRITHASPAGAFARVANRDWENDAEVLVDNADPLVCRDIAHQLVHEYPGNRFKALEVIVVCLYGHSFVVDPLVYSIFNSRRFTPLAVVPMTLFYVPENIYEEPK
ncbi:Membrane-bound alkaline phosphatase [Eumeta japonica]|uniref:Alkaline phosphatase n=1 Tax=Eumeta variegata TaxID=151549 RepID=A0A4C1ZEG5_EUMVA|nr:Membrane-bound alkaline phosphatase [Eumeta japonica]